VPLDDAILREARDARDRLIGLEREAELARVSYQHAIRRLHAGGGSLRDIADALGLSYQRVHQIVDVAAGKGSIRSSAAKPMRCSFCDRSQAEARKLIAGPGVAICDGCVSLAMEALDRGEAGSPGVTREAGSPGVTRLVAASLAGPAGPTGAEARCHFCGKRGDQASGIAVAPDRRAVAAKPGRSGRGARTGGLARRRRGTPPSICAECLDLCGEILAEELDD
jgi:ClpX C4-type zinc finger